MLQKGIVKKIVSTPFGNKMLYSIALVDTDGLFGFGNHNPKVKGGDTVEFEAAKNPKGFWQAEASSLHLLQEGSEVVSNGSSARPVAAAKGKEDYWEAKFKRDVRQDELREIGATRNTAIEWVKLLIEKEAVKLPTKVADREQLLNDLLNDYIGKFRGLAKEVPQKDAGKAVQAAPAQEAVTEEGDSDWN